MELIYPRNKFDPENPKKKFWFDTVDGQIFMQILMILKPVDILNLKKLLKSEGIDCDGIRKDILYCARKDRITVDNNDVKGIVKFIANRGLIKLNKPVSYEDMNDNFLEISQFTLIILY